MEQLKGNDTLIIKKLRRVLNLLFTLIGIVLCLFVLLLHLANRNHKATVGENVKLRDQLAKTIKSSELQNMTISSLSNALKDKTLKDSVSYNAANELLELIPKINSKISVIDKKYDTKINTYRIDGPGDAQLYFAREGARISGIKTQ